MKINALNSVFGKFLDGLNQAQRKAVESTEGPVLVIAGPGTGKTQMLAARIAHILQSTDCIPENILCMTYTDAGTIAMRSRLLQFIGTDAYRVPVFTFHAFCNKVIQENPEYFGLRALDAVSELEQRLMAREIIELFPQDHPLKRYSGDIFYETSRLIALWDIMKKENWTEEWLNQRISEYLKRIETDEVFIYKKDSKYGKKGEKKPTYFDEVKRMEQLLAGVKTFGVYNGMLAKRNRYDFTDMILWVIAAFKQHASLLSQYQEKYQYFLVDEYQDTSGSQNLLLDLLIAYWDQPNVFCVGDDDQSIYRFQGANVENIQEFASKYTPLKIPLVENYRSTEAILELANALIAHNQIRLNKDKRLIASGSLKNEHDVVPEVRSYTNPMHETVHIAKEIQQLVAAGVSGKEIAVLYRKHQQSEELIRYLKSLGIPVTVKLSVNIFEEPLIEKLVVILQYLAAEQKRPHSGEPYLFEMLHFGFFALHPLQIAELSLRISRANYSERTTSWRSELKKTGTKKQDLFNQDKTDPLYRASTLIESWISDSFNYTMAELVERIINQSGILADALTSVEKGWNMQLLHTFFEFVRSESARVQKMKLFQLIDTIILMGEEGVKLTAEKLIGHSDGVNFLTVHGAKGLEFSHVYVIGCNSNKWENSKEGRKSYKLPDNLFDIQSDDENEEHRRLFYVAITRAKKNLHVSYSKNDNSGKETEQSRFVAELIETKLVKVLEPNVSEEDMADFSLVSLLHQPDTSKVNLFDHELVDALLKDYSLSVTHLNGYLRCPTSFYFNNMIRVPAQMNASMTFGSAVHHALEQLFRKMNLDEEKKFPEIKELLNDFRWYMKRNEDRFTDVQYKIKMEYGEKILPEYYNKYIAQWNRVTSVERSYRNVVMDGVPVNGKIDKLEFDGLKVNVVDYKTGNVKKGLTKFNGPDSEKVVDAKPGTGAKKKSVFGGDYWRQAVFYKLLIDHDATNKYQVQSVEFDFIEPHQDKNDYVKQKVEISVNDEAEVKRQIQLVYRSIQEKKFEVGCGEDDCTWCNFVKLYYSRGEKINPELEKPIED